MTVSLVGDGIFLVAMAWQAYELWNAPAALSLLGIGMTVPMIAFLLPAGVLSDRLDRRSLMLCADFARAIVIAALAVLSLTGLLTFWELLVIVALYGVGTAFFAPAFEAIVPDIVPAPDLAAANSLDQFVRPIAFRLAGPALGGALVAGVGLGTAFAVDAATFIVSAVAVFLMRPPAHPRSEHVDSSFGAVKEGLRFVRRRVWLWGTLLSAAIAYLAFMGPAEVLLPYLVKNELHASAGDLGLVFAAGGVGAISAALIMGQRGHPGRDVTFMYATWTLATLAIAGYGLATVVLAAHGCVSLVQRTRNGGHHRLGDDQAAPRPGFDARSGFQPRLADLDRPPPAFLRPHGSRRRPGWRASDADRSGSDRRRVHTWRTLPPGHAGHRGVGRRGRRRERKVTCRRRPRASQTARLHRTRTTRRIARLVRQRKPALAGLGTTGATGLEPATPGFGDRCSTN